MADEAGADRGIAPDDDPYEFNWPDDAKELRAAEREERLRQAEIKPAPRVLTSYVIGVGTVLAFEIVASLIIDPRMLLSLGIATPVCGAGALIVGLALEVATRRLHPGLAAGVFLFAGAVIGFTWTYVLVGILYRLGGAIPEENLDAAASFRTLASFFIMTATATAFYLARVGTDALRKRPPPVYIGAGSIVVIALISGASLAIPG